MKALLLLLTVVLMACGNEKVEKEPGLKDVLEGKFEIGVALNTRQAAGMDTLATEIVKKHFNAIVAENAMKSGELLNENREYDFTQADELVQFGVDNNLNIVGHCLIWHSQLPQWFCVDENGENVTPEVLKERMKNHINTVVGRYKGVVKGWDVVNEAILEDGSYRNSKFYEILGEEFIPLAFQYAHEADPDAQLYYNDYNEWYPEKRKTVTRLINTIKERGLRIDGIGMQGHIGMTRPTLEEYQETIDGYVNAGVKVLITELDMSALPEPRRMGGANLADRETYRKEIDPYTEGLPEEVSIEWNNRMMDFFNLFLDNSDNIIRVTMWGVSDGDSWKNGFPVRGRTDYPLLFDRDHNPKPIVTQLISKLSDQEN
ncbi:MAG: endo-1,4-beta-xylanase [Fermentimonas sp.]|jgi:endo-1,4-beta-xylanase|nr:endo-1,4-beta-xylanase [Fermentimonas sp.]